MDELIYYNAKGNPADKKHATAFSYLASLHTTKTYHQYRQSPSNSNASVNLGIGKGSHLLVALPEKPIMHVYLYGKESPEQIIPLPEILTSLTTYKDENDAANPTLLLGGSKSGRLYVWSLHSGLLLTVKQGHYQPLTHIATYSGFIATGSNDSRIIIHSINSLFMNASNDSGVDFTSNSENSNDKPFAVITDHTLPITSLLFNKGLNNDIKLFSASLDSTVRIYSLTTSAVLNTTLVSTAPVTSIAADPSFRSLYLGMNNGEIRCVPLYKVNPRTKVIEVIGGLGKIVTIKPDVDLLETISCHKNHHKDVSELSITELKVSFDGTLLVSGDSQGSLFVIDITTKQVRKKLKELVGAISNIELWTVSADDEKLETAGVDKNLLRTIPVLKRAVMEPKDLTNQTLTMSLKSTANPSSASNQWDFHAFINNVQREEKAFANFSGIDSSTTTNTGAHVSLTMDKNAIRDLKKEVEEKTAAYDALKSKYDELLAEYSGSLSK